jgi:hypothetical protein
MFENRALGRGAALLSNPASTSTNLASDAGAWFEAGPAHTDEVWRVTGLECLITGPSALQALHELGGPGVSLEFGFDVLDPVHGMVDLAAVSLHTTDRVEEWNAGLHTGTVVDQEAGRYADGSTRAGLRGALPPPGTTTVTWVGPVTPFRYGSAIRFATWQGDFVRDPAGTTLPATRISLDVISGSAGGTTTMNRFDVAGTPAELDAGRRDFANPIPGDSFRWVVELDYEQTGSAAHDPAAVHRTGALFQLGAWIEVDDPWCRIDSLAELIGRSTVHRQPIATGWNFADDLFLVRLATDLDLRGRHHEKMRARLTGSGSLTMVEIRPTVVLELTD